MKQKYYLPKMLLYCICIFLLANCKVPYDPAIKPSDTNSLVVEGHIDGALPTIINLARSRMLTVGDTATRKYELGAKIIVEDNHQNTYALYETGGGTYSSLSTLSLNPTYQYRLHISTSDGKEYESDFVPFKSSPGIDSIGWNLKYGGVQVYVNTHDATNSTKYYRWEYSETWEFHSKYYSAYEYDPINIAVIPRTNQVYTCWQTNNSNSILLSSSAKLSNDVIYQMPLSYIPPHDQRLSVLYSIWVKQFALDVNGYNYWLAMKNNTEEVGSIFDPQPNESVGNIHCITKPSELVVGYINAGNTAEKREFISNNSLPSDWNQSDACVLVDVPDIKDSLQFYFKYAYTPIFMEYINGAVYYAGAERECVDCTLKGTNIKPTFWP